MALIGYTITVVAKQDNPYNVLPETDISIRKNSDNTLVNIYADEAGLIPIAQLGAKTDSNGQFTFYADASLGVLKAVWTNGGVIATEVLDQNDHSKLANRNAVGAHDDNSVSLQSGGSLRDAIKYVTPQMFGVVEGYDAGNASKIEAMLSSGQPVSWGGLSYGVDRVIGGGVAIEGAINWVSDGCEIYYGGSAQVQSVMHYQIRPLFHHTIIGKLTFNASLKANHGIWLENKSTTSYPDGAFSMHTDGLSAKNIRRTTDFSGGDGIRIEGTASSVVIDNAEVTNCVMAAGAGVSGSQGIAGISVVRDAIGGYPRYMRINNAVITDIKSEDLDYQMDQDGVRLFGGIESGDEPSFAHVSGGVFKNCFGRSVKCQVSDGLVQGATFIRDDGLNTNGNDEVAFLYGGGSVRDIQCDYRGHSPDNIVALNSSSVDDIPAGSISGVKIRLQGVSLPRVFDFFARKSLAGSSVIENVDIVGGTILEWGVFRVADNTSVCNIYNLNGSCTTNGFRVLATTGSNQTLSLNITNASQTGASVPLYAHKVSGASATAKVNSVGCTGWLASGNAINSISSNAPVVSIVNAMQGNYDRAASARMLGGRVGGTSEFRIPLGSTSNVTMCMFWLAGVDTALGMLSTSSTGVTAIAGCSALSLGTTSRPSSGNYRLHIDTTTNELVYYNATGTTRAVTVMVIGD